jgi:hypothetical protein
MAHSIRTSRMHEEISTPKLRHVELSGGDFFLRNFTQ